MPVVIPELVHLFALSSDWPGSPPPSGIPSKIYVGEDSYDSAPAAPTTADTFAFGPDHPARGALDADPDSYWYTGQNYDSGFGGGGAFGNAYLTLPPYPLHTPITFRFYARNVDRGGDWPDGMPFEIQVNRVPLDDEPSSAWYSAEFTDQGDGVWMAEYTGYPIPLDDDEYHAVFRPRELMVFGAYLRMDLFHVTAEWEAAPTGGGLYRLRQRQTLPAADSWPLRQRHNGSHTGSWPLRQRQTGI